MVYKGERQGIFNKIVLENVTQRKIKGGKSILTALEKKVIVDAKEVKCPHRLIAPFIFMDTFGAIYLKRKQQNRPFQDIEQKLFFSLSECVSLGFRIMNLYYEEKKIILNYIDSLTKLLAQYVPTSHIHVKSAFRLVRALGKELKIPPSDIKSLEFACLLHDAGKINIPAKLLMKNAPLTEKETKLLKMHPRKGANLIKDMQLLKPVIPIIVHHHEKYDGSGYPHRLKKEKIPLGSRILSVLDAFDAMYFGRPYKGRLELSDIEKEFKKQRGKQFDPDVVDAFLKILHRKTIRKYLKSFI